MKWFFALCAFAASIWVILEYNSSDSIIDELVGSNNSKLDSEYLSLVDKAGRELSCMLLAKDEDLLLIKRQSDGGNFLLNSYKLSATSRSEIQAHKDFNKTLLDEWLYTTALKELQIELLYVPELTSYRCSITGPKVQTCEGRQMDEFRQFLSENNVKYRESTLATRPAGNNSVLLPDGIRDVPCIKIGNEILYRCNKSQLAKLMADEYRIKYASSSI